MYKWIMLLYTLKKKNASHLYTQIQNKHKKEQERKKDKRTADSVRLRPWGSGLGHIPGAWAGWVPRRDCPGAEGAGGGDMPANEPLTPMDVGFLFPSAWVHNLQIQGPSCSRTKSIPPKGWRGLWAGRALQSALGPVSPGGGVPTSSLLP